MDYNVTVIVPVYNSEKYLNCCIKSLLKQSLKCAEFIFVDDGSTDGSVSIIESYANNDDRIKLIRQNNLFAGVARNKALQVASGKYVVFLDSDDYFENSMLENCFITAEKYSAEIVLFGYYTFDDSTGKRIKHVSSEFPAGSFNSLDLGNSLFVTCKTVPWNKFYNREFLINNNVWFMDIRKSNDVYFSMLTTAMASKMIYIPKCFVNYRVNNSGSLQGLVNSNLECPIIARKTAKTELMKRGLFVDSIMSAFYQSCIELKSYVFSISSVSALHEFYDYYKANMIPGLFSSADDFKNDYTINSLYISKTFEEFLFLMINRENYEKHIDYRIGHAFLAVPRKVLRFVRFYSIRKA